MKQQIANYFRRYADFSAAEIDEIFAALQLKTYDKKAYLLKMDQLCQDRFFIVNGLVRSFYINDKGDEYITQFGIENWWVTNLESFVNATPSTLYIQALEPTNVLSLGKSEGEVLFASIPKLERAFRRITENMLIAFQRRNHIYMKRNSKERYRFFMNTFPDFAQRIPQYMLASYLEMSPQHLSAIRGQ